MQAIAFSPLLPLPLIAALAVVAAVGVALALWRGLTGWWLRGLAALVLLAALAGPSLRREDRAPVANIAIVVIDDSASNRIDGRDAQVARGARGAARRGSTGWGRAARSRCAPCTWPTAARTARSF